MADDKEKSMPLISIIVCTYNRSHILKKTLSTLCAQTYPSYEIIVVNNNSTDDTEAVCREFPVEYIFEGRQGVAFARNTGLAHSRGDYVGFIDDDEYVEPGWCEAMLKAFSLDERVGAATGPVKPIYLGERPSWLPESMYDCYLVLENTYHILAPYESIGTGNSLMRREAVEGLSFRTDLGRRKGMQLSGEDTAFFRRIFDNGWYGAYAPDAAVWQDIEPHRMTLRWCMRQFFGEGVSEYIRKGPRVFWRRIYKPPVDLLALLGAVLTFSPRRIAGRWLRLCQTMGILYGPFYRDRS